MKKTIILFLMLANAGCIYGQSQSSKIEREIRDIEDRERVAMLNADMETLRKIWADDFTVNPPSNVGRITTTSQELFDMMNSGTIRFTSFTRNIEHITVLKDMAITMGSEEVVFTGNVPQAGQVIKRRFTNIWMKKNGEWRMSFRHANNLCQ
ncbi:MAG: nuclear transport factor 2 family protein [Bacteroidota bacterium]|jgi:ketosteroid isomerase-like protein